MRPALPHKRSTEMTMRSSLRCLGLIVILLAALPAVARAQETIEYYGTDAIGSIRIVFAPNGQVLGRQDYGPFGNQLLAVPQLPAERFGGQTTDDESQQANFHARMLQARTGRFTRPDPISGGLFEPQAWNRYAYVGNDPERFIDPSGESKDDGESKPPPTCADILKINPNDYWCGFKNTMAPSLFTQLGLFGVGGGNRGVAPGFRIGNRSGNSGNSGNGNGGTSVGTPNHCGGKGGGVIVSTGATGEAGVGGAGVSIQGTVGYGLFYDQSQGFSGDHIASGVALAYAGDHRIAAPAQDGHSIVMGAYAGMSVLTITGTNAHSAGQTEGPFTAYTLNVGEGPVGFSVQFAKGGPVWEASLGLAGPSAGISFSKVTTNTVVEAAATGCNVK
jgi:RHS repeat-associated protein